MGSIRVGGKGVGKREAGEQTAAVRDPVPVIHHFYKEGRPAAEHGFCFFVRNAVPVNGKSEEIFQSIFPVIAAFV